jgi:hypothetical protein
MSAKIIIAIGEYPSATGDVLVQGSVKFHSEKTRQDRAGVMAVLNEHLIAITESLEGNERINPRPLDEPCCDEFSAGAKGVPWDAQRCPYCGKEITDERREKFMEKSDTASSA